MAASANPPVTVVGTRQPDVLLGWMDSLADATRLRLLRLLEEHELGVTELVHILQMPQSTISRHLKVLADQGWVTSRAQATTNLYRMAESPEATARRLWLWAREQTESWATVQHDALRLARLLARREPGGPAFFAGAAAQWDRIRDEMYGRSFSESAMAALLPPDAVIADLGCGTGSLTASLAPWVGRVIGVDQSAAMLKTARRRTAGLDNVELRRGPLEGLPLEGASCDGALLVLALAYVDDPAPVLAEMARVVRPGGRGVVVDLLRHDRDDFRREMGQRRMGFEPEELMRAMEDAGFTDVRCRPLPPDPGAKGPALLLATGTRAGRAKR
jgi:ArsR family transcriptional regulator